MCPEEESNLRTRLRRPMLYPLSYQGRRLRRTRGTWGKFWKSLPLMTLVLVPGFEPGLFAI